MDTDLRKKIRVYPLDPRHLRSIFYLRAISNSKSGIVLIQIYVNKLFLVHPITPVIVSWLFRKVSWPFGKVCPLFGMISWMVAELIEASEWCAGFSQGIASHSEEQTDHSLIEASHSQSEAEPSQSEALLSKTEAGSFPCNASASKEEANCPQRGRFILCNLAPVIKITIAVRYFVTGVSNSAITVWKGPELEKWKEQYWHNTNR